jgi:hypothetical protein
MLDTGHDLSLGASVAAQLVGDQHTRRLRLLLQQLVAEAFGSLLVASASDEEIEDPLVDRAPEPVLLAGDGEDNLV